MCGICGQFNYNTPEAVQEEQIQRMAGSIVHRGPDDEGYFFDGALGLGFRRLSIIDLEGGHQPMSDQAESVWVVFNGEIYNFREIRSELESRGHRFRTNSDTEVIVHGYKQWGKDVLNRLNGMFGLAIWDLQKRRLIVARDAMGIKLVYYRLKDGILTFGSEIRTITANDSSAPSVNPLALNLFLKYRYTPSPLTIFQGIHKLAPGSMLVADESGCREERWYNFIPKPFTKPKKDREAEEELLELYRAAVKRHLISDVPVGILLSGGLDSGLLLGLMNECGGPWPAYTVGYGESFKDDELKDAEESAKLLGADFHPVVLDRREFERSLPKIVACLEEPIASSSIVPMYFVCQRAKQDVKVAIIGQGPDETFGGYRRHIGVHYGGLWRSLPSPVRSLASGIIQSFPRNETLKRGVYSLDTDDRLLRYQQVFSLAPSATIDGLFRERVSRNGSTSGIVDYWTSLLPQMEHTDELGGFQLLEVRSSLPDELLMFGDKLSMAHSLEGRVPYLDKTVVEYSQRLDASFKVRYGSRKWLHRRVCRNYLNKAIINRKKRGFAVNVVDDWFNSTVDSKLPEMLSDDQSLMYELLDPKQVDKLQGDHKTGRQDNHKVLFSLVMFEQWLRSVQ